jgi:hypothetical protein
MLCSDEPINDSIQYVTLNHSIGSLHQSRTVKPLAIHFLTHDDPSKNYGAAMIWTQFAEEFALATESVSHGVSSSATELVTRSNRGHV